jgi:putative tricarboxylic transport membrane protein
LTARPPGRDAGAGRKPPIPIGDLLMALAVLALGGWFLKGAFAVRLLTGYDRIGPRFFPLLVAGGLLLCGVLLLIQALRGRRAPLEPTEEMDVRAPADWPAVAILAAALVIDIVLIERLGFVLSSTLLFWGVAFGFGSRHYLRDALSGLALALAAYLTFTRLLDLNLPAGLLPLLTRALAGG